MKSIRAAGTKILAAKPASPNPAKAKSSPAKSDHSRPTVPLNRGETKTRPTHGPRQIKMGAESAAWAQVKRNLPTPDAGLMPAPDESAAVREGWDPVPASTGHHVHVPSGDDEDDEGRSDTERLVERGVKDAGRNQSRAAAGESD